MQRGELLDEHDILEVPERHLRLLVEAEDLAASSASPA